MVTVMQDQYRRLKLTESEKRELIQDAYERGGSWEEAARLLGVSTRTIYNLKKRLNMNTEVK